MSITATVVEDVLAAANRGESLIATGLDKRPWYSWKRYQSEPAGPDQLLSWAKQDRTAGYAAVTGEVSGFVVLDFDELGVPLVERHGLRPHVRTGSGGYHLRVQHPGFYVATQNSKVTKALAARWPGLDIRGDGGYAIEWGANQNGAYEALRDLSDLDDVDVLPDDMAAALGLLGADALDDLQPPEHGDALRDDSGKFHKGHRHAHLLNVACAMAGRGHAKAEVLAELRRVNQADCVPPHADAHLVEIATDVYKRYGTEPPEPEQRRSGEHERLDTLLRLAQNGAATRTIALLGDGPTAGIEIHLADGRALLCERFGDLWTHTGLARFITQTTGINASDITKVEAGEANAILRRLATASRATTIADLGCDHGVDFLSRAAVETVNVEDQGERYAAWDRLKRIDPLRDSDPRNVDVERRRDLPATIADAAVVLQHTDGRRLVRCDWLFAHVRRAGEVSHPAELAKRMEHAGWTRRGKRGAIKATSPSGTGPPLIQPFWIVPAGWEDSL